MFVSCKVGAIARPARTCRWSFPAAERDANAKAAERAHPLRLRRREIGSRNGLRPDQQLSAQQGGDHQFLHDISPLNGAISSVTATLAIQDPVRGNGGEAQNGDHDAADNQPPGRSAAAFLFRFFFGLLVLSRAES